MAPSSTSRAVAIAALLACAGIGGYCTMATGMRSGLFAAIENSVHAAEPYIPGGPAPLRTSYTGISGLDKHLMTLIAFFAFLTDGPQTWATTLAYYYLMTQLFAGWTLVVLEGHRQGSRGRAVSWTVVVGIIFQNITYTITVPLYLVLHICTSPLAASSVQASATNVAVDEIDDLVLALSAPLAFGVPAVMMSLPSPGQIPPATHYAFHALWQAFPVMASVYRRALVTVYRQAALQSRPSSRQSRVAPHRTYLAVLYASVISQLMLASVAITPASVVPEAWVPMFADVTLPSAFVSCWPWDAPREVDASVVPIAPQGLAELVKLFLQWDVYCGGVALMVWAVFLRSVAQQDKPISSSLPAVAFWAACGGPPAAAAMMLWERDCAAPREKAQ